MFRRYTSTNRTETETSIADILSRTHEEPEGLYEIMIAMTNELKNINKRRDEDYEEILTLRKEHEERKGSDATTLREDMRLLAQQVTKLKCKLREKDARK